MVEALKDSRRVFAMNGISHCAVAMHARADSHIALTLLI